MLKIYAGIITYNPNIEKLRSNIVAIEPQVDGWVLVDNGSDNWEEIKKLINNYKKIMIKRLYINQGIAKALNELCSMAIVNGYDWILTLDQDTICPQNIIEEYTKYLNLEKAAMLTSIIYDRNRKSFNSSENDEYSLVSNCITSGSLLNLNKWKEINGFDEYLFIDGVDFEICYKIISNNYKIYRINSVVLNHEIGKSEYKRIFWWKVIVMNHSAFRKYYIARNNIYLARKGLWKFYIGLLRNFKLLIITVLFEKNKMDKIVNILRGTIDGIKKH